MGVDVTSRPAGQPEGLCAELGFDGALPRTRTRNLRIAVLKLLPLGHFSGLSLACIHMPSRHGTPANSLAREPSDTVVKPKATTLGG